MRSPEQAQDFERTAKRSAAAKQRKREVLAASLSRHRHPPWTQFDSE